LATLIAGWFTLGLSCTVSDIIPTIVDGCDDLDDGLPKICGCDKEM
jgi:hypothetical protein